MTAVQQPASSAALRSPTGEYWIDRAAKSGQRRFDWQANPAVTQIVIGTPPVDEAKPISMVLPEQFAKLFPNLTHLYLWQIANLEQLPELPPGLQVLDVRRCEKLTSLPLLPATLTDLDLGECAALLKLPEPSPALVRLYLNDCVNLEENELTTFWTDFERLTVSPQLREFDGSRCPDVRSLKNVPRTVEKLVLEGCENLTSVKGLKQFTDLRHLNLSMCPGLTEISEFPEKPDDAKDDSPVGLQYVQLYGSENLETFIGQDIGPYVRGSKENPNVANILYSRKKVGKSKGTVAHAKLLLLGDGRVGKTTLAKRLQWDCLTPDEKLDPKNKHLCPLDKERFTHKVQFWPWNTQLSLDRDRAAKLNAQAFAAGLVKPCKLCDDYWSLPGTVRIWDFGGQEIYHQTHRIFAAEGSVFLLVWTDREPDLQALDAECPDGVTLPEWREWNRRHSLDYWLDYIDSIRPEAKVALVCTNVSQKAKQHPSLTPLAPRHSGRSIPCFYVDSLEENCRDNPEYLKLLRFIREKCGAEANRIGIIQPEWYAKVTRSIDLLLKDNNSNRSDDKISPHVMIPYDKWSEHVREIHRRLGDEAPPIAPSDIAVLTGCLHDAGNLFWLQSPDSPAVIIDQSWATDLIYELLHASPTVHSPFHRIRKNHGKFQLDDLKISPFWERLRSDAERQQIVSLMEQCNGSS